MTPYAGCGELAEFPNFGSVQLLRRVQLLGHVRYEGYCHSNICTFLHRKIR
jgi:hypothetical protein